MEPSKSIGPTSLVLKGKPRHIQAMMDALIERHGEDATLPEVYRNTIHDLKHPRPRKKD
jgi:hypothetical protein